MTPVEQRQSYDEAAAGLGRIARILDEHVDEPRHAAGQERLLLALARRSRRSIPRTLLLLGAVVTALAAVFALAMVRRPAVRLEYRVAGPAATDGPWLDVPSSGGTVSVRFSDGTEVDLGPGSKGRVAEIASDGASVILGAGLLQARVVHRPSARWTFAAGPYSIQVTGTAFDVEWSAAREQLELRMHDGSVVVRGPSLPDGLRIGAGQRLVAHADTGEAQLSSLLVPQRPEPSPFARPTDDVADPPPTVRPAPRLQPTWSEMLTDGNFRAVLEAAETRGIDPTLTHGSLADLVAFADAARYLHERALARRGLLAQRSRFAGSAEARAAAFVLGRMADDATSHDEAIRWYDTYLAESPQGCFAAEALGRKLVALVELGDAAGAHAVAREYVNHFPHGAHAAYARDHVAEP